MWLKWWQHICVSTIAKQCSLKASSAHSASRLGEGNRLRGDTANTTDPNWPKLSTLHGIMLSNKSQRTGGRERCFGLWHFSSQVAVMYAVILLSRKCQNICLMMETRELILCFAFLVHTALLHLLSCLYHSSWVFSFWSFDSHLHPSRGWGEWASAWVGV